MVLEDVQKSLRFHQKGESESLTGLEQHKGVNDDRSFIFG